MVPVISDGRRHVDGDRQVSLPEHADGFDVPERRVDEVWFRPLADPAHFVDGRRGERVDRRGQVAAPHRRPAASKGASTRWTQTPSSKSTAAGPVARVTTRTSWPRAAIAGARSLMNRPMPPVRLPV